MKTFFLKNNNKDTQQGFTIIETLVAISILLISTTGPLSFAQSSLRSSFLARDQVAAFYLAQEAVETIKNIRDNNKIQDSDWLDGLGDCTPASNGDLVKCNMEVDTGGGKYYMVECTRERCSPMMYDSANKQFVLGSGSGSEELSKYTRTVYLKKVGDDELQIIVEVDWTSGYFAPRRIIVQENIFKRN
jgi:prepilin-type N-terminal cleavage/methylation domain-containing protein